MAAANADFTERFSSSQSEILVKYCQLLLNKATAHKCFGLSFSIVDLSRMPRPIQALISLEAITHNLSVVRRAAPNSRIWGIVKANAYGHGLARVLPAMQGADGIALLDMAEAQLLRQLGYAGPVLLLEGCFDASDLDLVARLGLSCVLHCDEQLRLLLAWKGAGPLNIYLKMNSGMNRLGFPFDRMVEVYGTLRQSKTVGTITLMTHFARAEMQDGIVDAMARFDAATHTLPGERSLSNSAATLMHPAAHRDWVRPGIALYGSSPFASKSALALGLKTAMSLSSRLISIQHLYAGDTVGYGARFKAEGPMRVGVVACGYADGYPRSAPDGTPVLVGGRRTRLVGTVSMDMLTVDLSDLPWATVGTPVELWGEALSVDEVAQYAGTVGYELLCALAPRVPVAVSP